MPFISTPEEFRKYHQEPCRHPEHDPPSMLYLAPGHYTWECPSCGQQQSFNVHGTHMNAH